MQYEFNGYGETKLLKGTHPANHAPMSQENVTVTPSFKEYLLTMLASNPALIDPTNANPVLLSFLGTMAIMNQVIVKKTTLQERIFSDLIYQVIKMSRMAHIQHLYN